jgi:aminoglycoside phosphotransferase (APT) family kinase protein
MTGEDRGRPRRRRPGAPAAGRGLHPTLSLPEVAPYLLRRGLVGPSSVVDGALSVEDVSRRNRNYRAVRERGPSYLLKQGAGGDGIATVAHEAAVYRRLEALTGHDRFRRYLPRSYGYDSERHVLVVELLQDGRDLGEYHAAAGRFPRRLATELGNALGKLHRATRLPTGTAGSVPASDPGGSPPHWVLRVHRPHLALYRDISAPNIELVRIIQQSAPFCRLLDELRRGWQTEALIHNDVKWTNCVVFAPAGSQRVTRLKLVDWELAQLGDPAWDVGSVFSSYLSAWLASIPITGHDPPDRFPELARHPLERMQPAMRAFWVAYCRRTGADPADPAAPAAPASSAMLLRATRYAAARLVQTAYEHLQAAPQLTGYVICSLQLGLNVLQRPHEAAAHLFGIPAGSGVSP